MFDKFVKYDDASRKVLTLAQEEVVRFNNNQMDTDHLLLGLLRQEASMAAKVLYKLGLSVTSIRGILEKENRVQSHTYTISITPALERVLYLAQEETNLYVSPEHLLLALANVYDGNGAIILEQFELTPEKITQQVKEYLK